MRRLIPGLLCCCCLVAVQADTPVHFADSNLKAVVEDALWLDNPTATDMLTLDYLNAGNCGITDLAGLEYATNLQTLFIRWNSISDISALAYLTNLVFLDAHAQDAHAQSGFGISDLSPLSELARLETLILRDNSIKDISPLSGLTSLRTLHLEWNGIEDISALAGMAHLEKLNLAFNRISDLSPLSGLTSLQSLNVRANPLNSDTLDIYIPLIQANNPGIDFLFDPCSVCRVHIASTAGGSVINPGEGEFVFANGQILYLQVQADPLFVFTGWSGSATGPASDFFLPVTRDHLLQANFVSVLDVLYVDGDAPYDHDPYDPHASVPQEDGTAERPFRRIQQAIDVAADGATIIVRPGIYHECVDLLGKSIHLLGMPYDDPNSSAWPVIDGTGDGPVMRFAGGEDPNCIVQGFVITRGEASSAAAIYCSGASPTFRNCLIVGNRATGRQGSVINCQDSRAVFVNCTIADNYAGADGAGLYLKNSPVTVTQSILWGNWPAEILWTGETPPSITFSNVTGGWPGQGNIAADPQFARVGHWAAPHAPDVAVPPETLWSFWVDGDYHLQSQAGRWDPHTRAWVYDEVTSPCIDAGDPECSVGQEPAPNGGVINLGAYGGTVEASKSFFGEL